MPRRPLLEFEKPLVELEQQIEQIRQRARDSEVDVSPQLHQLEMLAARRREEIFKSLTPAQKIQVARHPHRPSTLDYIQMLCDDWVELHGDRRGSDGGILFITATPAIPRLVCFTNSLCVIWRSLTILFTNKLSPGVNDNPGQSFTLFF